MAGNNTETLSNTETQGCLREPAADGGMEITACCSDTLLGPAPRRPGSKGPKPEGEKPKRAKPKDAKPRGGKPKDAKPKGAAWEQQEPGRNNGSSPGQGCQLHAR